VLAAHGAEVERFRGGEAKLMGFFVGQVMKRSKGKADPKAVQPVLQEKLLSR
jgi:aspartyl-tRNA(Asn)/glutamyl-tRNA(Gln) amidotransferase subunit B